MIMPPRAVARFARRLRRDEGGLALLEFAFTLPLVLAMGGYGIEISNLALNNLRVSQYALELADNAARIGVANGLSTYKLDETDINEVLQATKYQGQTVKLTTYGRVTLSSLEGQANGSQLLHWQRCIGMKTGSGYDSAYSAGTGTGGKTVTGVGNSSAPVVAPSGSGVMFVEINYDYQGLFGTLFVKATRLHYIASFIVRDNRDYSAVTNTSNATASSCSTPSA